MRKKIDYEAVIRAYKEGESMNSIALAFGTYATSVKRILERHGVELRHDEKKEGALYVKDGEKLIEWAKAQGRLVTKAELAAVIDRRRLSPSYFLKYPELGQYVASRENKDIRVYTTKLFNWLKKNNIPYKPNDRTKLHVNVDALLLGEYSNLAIQVAERPYYVSKRNHEDNMKRKMRKANEAGMVVVFLSKEHFENLDDIKGLLDSLKRG